MTRKHSLVLNHIDSFYYFLWDIELSKSNEVMPIVGQICVDNERVKESKSIKMEVKNQW